METATQAPDPNDMVRRLERLAHLGVPEAFRVSITGRARPRLHTVLPLTIVLGAIAAAVAVLVWWSSHLRSLAAREARTAGALLYDNDFGPGEVALLFAVLLLAGWFFATLVGSFGIDATRDRWAHDMMQQPARYKAAVDMMWRSTIARHGRNAQTADAFLDQLASGLTRDIGRLAFGVSVLTGGLAIALPAHVAFATPSAVSERPIIAIFGGSTTHALSSATGLTTGCATIQKVGPTLSYLIEFSDGTVADLGGWMPTAVQAGAQIAALEAVAGALPAGIPVKRWRDVVGRAQLQAPCLKEKAATAGKVGKERLEQLLHITPAERAVLGPTD